MAADILSRAEAEQRSALVGKVEYHVSLDLSDDPAKRTYLSTTRIDFDCAQADASTFLNLTAGSVVAIKINGRKVDPRAFANNRIALDHLMAGRNQVEVVAGTTYMQNGVGLHRKVDPSDNRTYLYTHFEPFDAHRVYACFDQPDIKATFTLDVKAPSEWVVASNEGWQDPKGQSQGSTTQVQDLGKGRTLTRFATTKPLPPYLTHVTAGPYVVRTDSHHGLPLFVMARQSQRDVLDRNAKWMFAQTKEGLDLFQKAFGFPYQFAQYGQAFVPEFNAGAMENPGCVTFNDSYIPKGRASHSQMRRLAEVILHEMAHVYGFGDVTTMQWWNDLHLNETFATFMAYYTLSKSREFSKDAWLEFAQTEKTAALAQDQLPSTHPVKAEVTTTEEVNQLFDQITYAKGACVIRQLFALIGEPAFFAGLRDYFAKHWFGNATQADFLNALAGADPAGHDLNAWGRDWMGKAWVNTLKPTIQAGRDGRITHLAIEQSAPSKYPTLRTHHIAIGLYDLNAHGKLVLRDSVEFDINGPHTDVLDPRVIGQKRPDLILVNDGDLTYAKVRFDDMSLKTLGQHVGDITDPLARTVTWTALWDMTRDAELPARSYVDLVAHHARQETAVTILERLLSQATMAANSYCAPDHRQVARAQLADVAHDAIYAAKPGSDGQLAWLRTYVSTAETGRHLDDLTAMLAGSQTVNGIEVAADADIRWQIVLRLAAAGRVDARRIHDEYLRDPSDVAQRREAAGLAAIPTPEAKATAFERILKDRNLPLATIRAICMGEAVGGRYMGGFHQPGQEKLLEPYVDKYLAAVPDLWATREENEAEDITSGLFPNYAINESTVRKTQALLHRKLPYGADRMLREAKDGVQRALQAQRKDALTAPSPRGPSDGVVS